MYHWPVKIRKFNITDPFLKRIATKYEKEIPWQKVVRDSKTLLAHIRNEMIPRLLERVEYPSSSSGKSFFITCRHVHLSTALRHDQELDHPALSDVKQILASQGETAATELLVEKINRNKAAAFRTWVVRLEKNYPDEHAFWLLLLRSIFELSGCGTRRILFTPSDAIIDWLHRKIQRDSLSPYENLSGCYWMKLGAGTERIPRYGWSFIAAAPQNAAQLAAISHGSGWCIAGEEYALHYLSSSNFYILHFDHRPVVALRQNINNGTIIECQGRYNKSPTDWFQDIQLFLETRELALEDRKREMDYALKKEGNFDSKSFEWWLIRIRLWPFSLFFAPQVFRDELISEAQMSVVYYAGFFDYEELKDLISFPPDLGMGMNYWQGIIEMNPNLYTYCPETYRESDSVKMACVGGWSEKAEEDEITLLDFKYVPEFVKISPRFLNALQNHFPSALQEQIRQFRSTSHTRENPFWLNNLLPIERDEPADLVIERMINVLLNNEDGIFSDHKFPDIIRERKDFRDLRVRAWQAGIQVLPPLYFALPSNLQAMNEFQLNENKSCRLDITTWSAKVQEKPWLLTQKNGIPKTIHYHYQILQAYYKGWRRYLINNPACIWVKRGLYRRVYMSYALLADENIIEALSQGWQMLRRRDRRNVWLYASPRMRDIPALQVSMLRAINRNPHSTYPGEVTEILEEIEQRHNRDSQQYYDAPAFIQEIHTYLTTGIS